MSDPYILKIRIIFYLGRMISAQKEVEFQNSRYDDLKAVRSIWICMDSADDEDSINRIRFDHKLLFSDIENLNEILHRFSIVALKDDFNRYSNRFLLHYDTNWNCWFFFSFPTSDSANRLCK